MHQIEAKFAGLHSSVLVWPSNCLCKTTNRKMNTEFMAVGVEQTKYDISLLFPNQFCVSQRLILVVNGVAELASRSVLVTRAKKEFPERQESWIVCDLSG